MSNENKPAEEVENKQEQAHAEEGTDFLSGVKACDLSGEGACEACQ